MKSVALALLALLLAACASAPPMPPANDLFHDDLFGAPSAPIDRAAPLALSDAMRRYLAAKPMKLTRQADRRQQLIDALYHGDLKLEYDAAITRTASQAFDARSGNCLALVLMTAAFAKELGLTVTYQAVLGEEGWDRADDLYIALGHVNLALEDRGAPIESRVAQRPMIVDFLPARDRNVLNTRPIAERTVIAMYFNNRAVESMTQRRLADAYWFAREAVREDPQLHSAYITLAVVYREAHQPGLAEQALQRVAERDPDNLNVLSNRVLVLRDLGRNAEADVLAQRLAQLDPHPPFSYFHAGRAALREGRLDDARRLFAKEVQRAPYHHEFEYWLAVTYAALNDPQQAALHLRKAMDVSTTRKDHDLYAGKLDRLKALMQ
jgi:tetratricopeptide (TPR) repeat protein